NHWDEWAKQTHPDDIDRVTQAIQEHLAGKTPFYSTEYRVLCKNRTYKWVHDRGQALWDEEGNPVRMVGSYTDITARKRAEEAWREQQEWFRVTLASIGDAVIATDTTGAVIFVNPVAAKITGFTEEEALGQPIDEVFQIINEETRLPAEIPVNRVLQDGTVVGLANHTVLVSRNGTEYPIADSAAPIRNDRGEVLGVVMVFQNVTERRESEEALRESEAKLRRITDNMLDMIAETDHRLVFQYVSPSNKNTLGYGPEAMLGKSIHYFLHPDDLNRVDAAIKVAVEKKSSGRIEFRYRHVDGHYLWIETVGTFQFDHNGLLAGAVFCSRDVTERKKMEEELKYFSLHDPLTRLYNRTFFEEEMRRLGDGRCTSIGLIVCDLDGLKFVNDTLGHESGDSLIEVAARLIKQCVRVSDMVARIGGDEFAILLPNNDSESVEAACNRIRKAMKQYNVANPELPLSISIGYATRTGTPKDMRELFREADNNMYREKLSRSRSTRSAIVQVLKKAMEARDFITEGHAERLQDMAAGLAETIGLSSRRIADLRLLAQFHDIGKVGVPDHILFKQGPLTIEETREIRRHCEIGQRIALTAPELIPIADWILKHHEWWDGQGYPMGLKGEKIPLECRILAIVDAYDAMTSDRPYRKAMSTQKAITELYRYMGIQFDPQLVPKFVQILNLNA
ncbi:MAG: PAS domain S-box protein, partial [Heliobacteriaceae bacterium]|nr:PAS domain S-box protein [Heliobacteriaceae bacterium]